MKQITIAGRVGKDGELRRTQKDETVLGFSVAVDDGYGENKSTLWFDCSVWGKRASSLEPHIKKGVPITIAGEFGKREHDGKTYLTVRVNDVTLQGSVEKKASRQPDDGDSYGGRASDLDSDTIPF
jgi:single-strand DNA-binding protein